MNKKLFAFDMDGTILNDDDKILNETILAIKEARNKGHKTAIITGRPYKDIVRDVDKKLFDYIVPNNGSYFYVVSEEKFYYEYELPKFLIKEAISIAKDHNCYIIIHGEKEAKRAAAGSAETNFDNNDFKEFKKFKDEFLPINTIKDFGEKEKIMQISLRSDSKSIIKIRDSFNVFSSDVDVCISNDVYVDLNLKGINKWEGIKKIMNHLEEKIIIYSFGDSSNDLLMLKNSDFSFAMENGNQEAKNNAKQTIGSNNTNSIANVILENI